MYGLEEVDAGCLYISIFSQGWIRDYLSADLTRPEKCHMYKEPVMKRLSYPKRVVDLFIMPADSC